MALYIVLHHPSDPHQPWANAWERNADDRIEGITTAPSIAKAAESEGRVFVHRCGFGTDPPAVVAEAEVLQVAKLDGRSWYVTFRTRRTMRAVPAVTVDRGTNSYVAAPVE